MADAVGGAFPVRAGEVDAVEGTEDKVAARNLLLAGGPWSSRWAGSEGEEKGGVLRRERTNRQAAYSSVTSSDNGRERGDNSPPAMI
jgi:glycine/D-amino acid oxidase-like deaminating enzyme